MDAFGDARVREHGEEGIEVRLVGAAEAVRVNRRPQWWRSYSALAAALALVALIAVVLSSPGSSPALAATETKSAPAILSGSAGPPSAKTTLDASLPLRQMLKIHNPRRYPTAFPELCSVTVSDTIPFRTALPFCSRRR